MDGGAKGFFRKLKRIQFWAICPLVILIGLISWFLAVGAIQKQKETNKAKIAGYDSTLNNVEQKRRHANDNVNEGMEALIAKRRSEVAEAWTERWDQQTGETNIFKWPDELGPGFISKVEGLRPIETTVGFPPEQELVITLRRKYRYYIKKELPKLAKQIGAEWMPNAQGGRRNRDEGPNRRQEGRRFEGQPPNLSDRTPGVSTKAFSQSLVRWSPENQSDIEKTHFDWSNEEPPGLLDILYAHEDLTVLRSIMNVISKANEGAATRFNAAVKEIEFIHIGKNAAPTRMRVIFRPGAATTGLLAREPGVRRRYEGEQRPSEGREGRRFEGQREGRFEGQREGRFEGEPMQREGRYEGGQRMGFQQGPGTDPANMRYVDNQYNPLPASTLRSVLKKAVPGQPSEPIEPEFAYLAVAKRIPVRMRFRVDQRKLNRLLAECANSELTIEIRQIRINPDKQGSTPTPGARGMRRRNEGQGTRQDRDNSSEELFQYDVDVELYGIVYVYNPVNKEVLGIEEEASGNEGIPVAAN